VKIELKNFKYSELMSHETYAFEATVWVDGKRAFTAENSGQGGGDFYFPVKGQTFSDMKKIHKQIAGHHRAELLARTPIKGTADNKWIKKLSDDAIVEVVIADLIKHKHYAKDMKKDLKKSILIRKPDGVLEVMKFKGEGRKKIEQCHINYAKRKHPDCLILNDLPFEEALDVFITYMEGEDS
tara:strand:- start:766 stop:1314 length:549 start_codon:yes stop_codon:yes gene_type:complete